jgi:acetylornithine deacetylase/succinyl-diaminopimelate desuccinylase-like protein
MMQSKMPDEMKDVFSHIQRFFDDHLECHREFIRQPSISADGNGMEEMAALVARTIGDLGGTTEVCQTDGHPVVHGEIDAGKKHTLLVYGMYDVQPVAGEEWIVPPFEGQITEFQDLGRCMVARGVMNSKGPLAGFLCAMRSVRDTRGSLPVNLKFVVEGEEELGSVHLPQFVEEHKARLAADAVFFPFYSQDRIGKVAMYLGVKGLVFLELVARGGQWGGPTKNDVHGMNAGWFHSPAWALTSALATMLSWDQKQILVDGLCDDVAPPSCEDLGHLEALSSGFDETIQLRQYDVERFKYELKGTDLVRKFLFEPSLNIDGLLSGHPGPGMKTVLPHEARAKIDVRLVPNMEPAKVVEQMRAHIRRRGFSNIEVNEQSAYPWSKSSVVDTANSPLIDTYRSLGFEPEVWPLVSGSAPFYLFTRELGIPIAMGGLGHGGRQHSPNEYATVTGMELFERSCAAYVMKCAGA